MFMAIRCFIAIELDESTQRELGKIQSRLRDEAGLKDRSINWVRPENIHLTLKFLGEVDDADIPLVCEAASSAAGEFLPFEFEIGSVGCFPPGGSARVLWAAVTAGEEQIVPIHRKLDELLHKLGFPLEGRRFAAHLTLARIKNIRVGHEVREGLEGFTIPKVIVQSVSTLTVFQSVLSRGGPTYTAMHHAELG
jgi:RNA 2',3'-cyclic 3'-phosphodiesterase